MTDPFVHLHLHSQFSLQDGIIREKDLAKRVEEMGQPAVAITDHGSVSGSHKLVKACKDRGVKPIIGCELYVATEGMDKDARGSDDNWHLTILAKNRDGYRNLLRLVSEAHVRGLHWKPRVDHDLLEECAEGTILLSGCIGAELPQKIIWGDDLPGKNAEQLLRWYQRVWGDDFFIEVMSHGDDGEVDHVTAYEISRPGKKRALRAKGIDPKTHPDKEVRVMQEGELNAELVRLARKHGIGIAATNDAHYLHRRHGFAHDLMLAEQFGTGLRGKGSEDRMRFPGAEHLSWEFYVKTGDEMKEASDADWWEEACRTTTQIANRIEDDVVPVSETALPPFDVPDDDFEYLAWKQQGMLP